MNAALVGLHSERLAAARAAALEAIRALSDSVEAIRKAEMDADFQFALPWPELTRLIKAKEDVGRIDYLAALTLRSEVTARHEECCASVTKQLIQEMESRRLAIGKLDSELWNAKSHAQTRVAKANATLAAKKHYALSVTVPSAMAHSEPPGGCAQLACMLLATVAWLSWVTSGMNEVRLAGLVGGVMVVAISFLGVPLLGAYFPYLLRFGIKLLRVSKAESQARQDVAAAQAACVKETADAENELALASQSLGASLETAQKRFASAQSAGNGLAERLPQARPATESKAPPPLPQASPGSDASFVISLTSAGNNLVAVIKSLRELVPGLGLAQAKAFAEDTPSIVAHGLTRSEAENFRKRLETVGAKVEIL